MPIEYKCEKGGLYACRTCDLGMKSPERWECMECYDIPCPIANGVEYAGSCKVCYWRERRERRERLRSNPDV